LQCLCTATPQWRGVHRDGNSQETGLLKSWPKDGPKFVWKNAQIGGGYSTPSVVGDRVYLMCDMVGEEYLVALDVKDGKEQWRTRIGQVGKKRGAGAVLGLSGELWDISRSNRFSLVAACAA
jgi:hypothetical protein